jgi:hypothetical protein
LLSWLLLPASLQSLLPKTLTEDVPTVLTNNVVLMVSEEVVELAQLDKDVLEANVSATVVAQALNVDLTIVEPLVVNVLQDKLVSLENVLELVLLNVSDLMEV